MTSNKLLFSIFLLIWLHKIAISLNIKKYSLFQSQIEEVGRDFVHYYVFFQTWLRNSWTAWPPRNWFASPGQQT